MRVRIAESPIHTAAAHNDLLSFLCGKTLDVRRKHVAPFIVKRGSDLRRPILCALWLAVAVASYPDRGAVSGEGGLIPGTMSAIQVPSGQIVAFVEIIRDVEGVDGMTTHVRFVAPDISRRGGVVSFEQALRDMEHVCNEFATSQGLEANSLPAQVVISFSDVFIRFGQAAPDATQYFESYTLQDGRCISEPF